MTYMYIACTYMCVYFIFYRYPSVMDAVFVEEKKGDRKKIIEKFVSLFLPGTYHEV